MDLNLLKTFYEVAIRSSFTEASKKLFITQPAVTSQIKTLEESLGGANLFKKVGRRIFLTDEGKTLLRYATKLIDLENEIMEIFNELSKGIKGTLTIGATYVMGTYFLPRILGRFKSKYPFVDIKTIINNSSNTINSVLNGKVDIAISGIYKEGAKSLTTRLFHTEKMVFIVSPSDPLAQKNKVKPQELKDVPFIAREVGTITRKIADKWLKEHDLYKNLSLELGNVEAVKRMVEEGFGITIIPEIAIQREVKGGYLKILNVEGSYLSVDYHLIYPKDALSRKTSSAFIEFILE